VFQNGHSKSKCSSLHYNYNSQILYCFSLKKCLTMQWLLLSMELPYKISGSFCVVFPGKKLNISLYESLFDFCFCFCLFVCLFVWVFLCCVCVCVCVCVYWVFLWVFVLFKYESMIFLQFDDENPISSLKYLSVLNQQLIYIVWILFCLLYKNIIGVIQDNFPVRFQ
jgi:formate/nitrite transporter FocA (FNT family)